MHNYALCRINKYNYNRQIFFYYFRETWWITVCDSIVKRNSTIMGGNEVYNLTTPSNIIESEIAFWNYTNHVILDDLKMDSNFIWLLCSLVSVISWIVYIAYYNSRVAGYIITKLLNRFIIRDGYVKVGKKRM